MSRDRYERRHRAKRAATIARNLAKTGPLESNDVKNPFVGTRPGRCHVRPTDGEFAPYPVGTRVSVFWGASGRLNGVVVGRTSQRLRVLLDPPFSHRRHQMKGPSGEITVWDTSPSPRTVIPIPPNEES